MPIGIDIALRFCLLAACPALIAALRLVHPEEIAVIRGQLAAWGMMTPATGPAGPPGAPTQKSCRDTAIHSSDSA
jgi:hypothetical protein